MSGFLGSGKLYANRKVGGEFQGLKLLGNATMFEIKENSEKKERTSKDRANYGSALDTVFVKKPAEIKITLDELDKENLALVFLGTSSAVSVTAGTVTDEVIVAQQGLIFETAHRNISNVVLTNSAASVTYVLGTDYQITNAKLGLIKVIGSTITNGQSLKIDYSYGAMTSNKVAGGTNSSIIVKLLFDGLNQADQAEAIVSVHQATLSPTSGVDFLADDFTKIELAGIAVVPAGGAEAYTVELGVAYG